MLALTAILVVRLFILQVVRHSAYAAQAENQHQLFQTLLPARGQIFVRENRDGRFAPAVTNIDKNLVYAVPQEIENPNAAASSLAKVLNVPKAEILTKISDLARRWVALKKELAESESLAVAALKLKGIYLEPDHFRFYPENSFASQVLGFYAYNGDSRAGQYGIEEYYEDLLAGKAGSLSQEKDRKGAWITGSAREYQAAENGADIFLTLDRAVQFQAEKILKNTVDGFEAEDGSLIVMEPKTGKILAMASYPTFDPNVFGKASDPGAYRNRVVSDAYEIGSVFKPVTMSAALDTGAVQPDTTFIDTGSAHFGEFTIRNALNKIFGLSSMTRVLEQSINTGAIFAEQQTGKDKFYDYVKRFGFGARTGITLPAESAGDLRNLARGEVNYATAAFGQGITATPLQLAEAYSAMANGGKMMKPYIVDHINLPDGATEATAPQDAGQVISAETAGKIGAMLVSVVENGHGKRAAVPGYYIAGKTGTAQMARTDGGSGYDPNRTIGTFAGFGPLENPAFTIVVKITNPRAVKFAESTTAPAFGEMAKFLLNYLQISPTR